MCLYALGCTILLSYEQARLHEAREGRGDTHRTPFSIPHAHTYTQIQSSYYSTNLRRDQIYSLNMHHNAPILRLKFSRGRTPRHLIGPSKHEEIFLYSLPHPPPKKKTHNGFCFFSNVKGSYTCKMRWSLQY